MAQTRLVARSSAAQWAAYLERRLRVEALDGETRADGACLEGPELDATSEGSRRHRRCKGDSQVDGLEEGRRELHGGRKA